MQRLTAFDGQQIKSTCLIAKRDHAVHGLCATDKRHSRQSILVLMRRWTGLTVIEVSVNLLIACNGDGFTGQRCFGIENCAKFR